MIVPFVLSGGVRRAVRAALSMSVVIGIVSAAAAEVRTTTSYRSYSVGGSTARSLVSYMRSHPFRGDHGDAVANVRPLYRLSVATRTSGGTCRASNVTLSIAFTITLPSARSESSMASSTRSAWQNFVAFARRHESTHRSIYIGCGNNFVAKAQHLTASSCAGLQASIRRLLESEKRSCEVRQRSFDRSESRRVSGLSLLRMAR
jgi:predicted secreted Zn-dependent protease